MILKIMSSNLIIRHNSKNMTMSFKKYKKFRASSTFLKLSNIFKKSIFIGFFQLKSFNLDEWIKIKQLIFKFNLKIIVCKNTYLQKNMSLPSVLSPIITQGNLVILYSFSNLPTLETINIILSKFRMLTLFFYLFKKFVFLNKLSLLLNNYKTNFVIDLVILLENHRKNILSILSNSNQCIFNVLRI